MGAAEYKVKLRSPSLLQQSLHQANGGEPGESTHSPQLQPPCTIDPTNKGLERNDYTSGSLGGMGMWERA